MYFVNIGLISLTRLCCKTEDIGGKLTARGDKKLGKKKESTEVKVKQFDNPSTNCKQLSHFHIDFQASQKGKEIVKSGKTFKTPLGTDPWKSYGGRGIFESQEFFFGYQIPCMNFS